MGRYIVVRLVSAVPTVFGVLLIVFFIVRLVPGDPVDILVSQSQGRIRPTPEYREKLRHQLGLDRPIYEQFVIYVGNVARGDLGESIYNQRPVTNEIARRLPNTLKLAAVSFLVTLLLGVTTGIVAATHKGTLIDLLSTLAAIVSVSIPAFWLGLMAILLFSLRLGWLPVSGASSWKHLILPGFVLGIRSAATLARLTRSAMLDVLNQDYIRTARAKGLRDRVVVFRHGLRNALIPIATVLGFEIGALLTGAFIIEVVFAYPGIGQLAVQSLELRDFPMVQGVILFVAIVYVGVNLLVDLLYAVLDPRIRYS